MAISAHKTPVVNTAVKMINRLAIFGLLTVFVSCQPASPPSAKQTDVPSCTHDYQCVAPWHPTMSECVSQLSCVGGQCLVPASQTGLINESIGRLEFDVGQGIQSILVEIADNEFERSRGLMCRETLLPNWGMLFVMPQSEIQRFWMKNTLIPLDMLFLDDEWQILGFLQNVPPMTLEGRGIETPSRYVLELKAGEIDRLGLAQGLELRFAPPNAPQP